MTRAPLVAAAVLVAGLLLAACGSTSVGHGGAPKSSPTPSATAKPLSAAAAAEAGFRAWAEASDLLTGPMPASSRPAAEEDILVLGRAFAMPGWRTAVGKGLVLQETPAGCQASLNHLVGEFAAPQVAGAGPVALVDHEQGPCVTAAGGITYILSRT